MDPSITEKILAAVFTNVTARVAASGITVTVERSRRRPAEVSELPLLTIRPFGEQVVKVKNNWNCPAVERSLTFVVTVRCMGEDTDLDAIRSLAIEGVMGDITLSGMVTELEEIKHDWDGEGLAAEADFCECSIHFSARYQTGRATAVTK